MNSYPNLPLFTAWARDRWLTKREWSKSDFIFHGWQKWFIRQILDLALKLQGSGMFPWWDVFASAVGPEDSEGYSSFITVNSLFLASVCKILERTVLHFQKFHSILDKWLQNGSFMTKSCPKNTTEFEGQKFCCGGADLDGWGNATQQARSKLAKKCFVQISSGNQQNCEQKLKKKQTARFERCSSLWYCQELATVRKNDLMVQWFSLLPKLCLCLRMNKEMKFMREK